jgi:hypothetical protein
MQPTPVDGPNEFSVAVIFEAGAIGLLDSLLNGSFADTANNAAFNGMVSIDGFAEAGYCHLGDFSCSTVQMLI